MKVFAIAVIVLGGLAVAGFKGCEEKGSAPKSDEMAYCQTHYKDMDSCKADAKCRWSSVKSKCVEADEDHPTE